MPFILIGSMEHSGEAVVTMEKIMVSGGKMLKAAKG
jgi:hypothetical protein